MKGLPGRTTMAACDRRPIKDSRSRFLRKDFRHEESARDVHCRSVPSGSLTSPGEGGLLLPPSLFQCPEMLTCLKDPPFSQMPLGNLAQHTAQESP